MKKKRGKIIKFPQLQQKNNIAEQERPIELRLSEIEDLCERLVVQIYDLTKEKERLNSLVFRLLRQLKREKDKGK